MITLQVAKKYPVINDYDGLWPVCAMLKMSLKNSAQHARKKGAPKAVQKNKVHNCLLKATRPYTSYQRARNSSVESED